MFFVSASESAAHLSKKLALTRAALTKNEHTNALSLSKPNFVSDS